MADSAAPQTMSKREQKRQKKVERELAEKSQANGLETVDLAHGQVLPILDKDSSDKAEPSFELAKSPYIEPVQKRIRNYLKKKQKIDQLSERAHDPEEAKKLNKDQLDTLARKDQVLAPLKELQNLAEQLSEIETEHNNTLKSEAAESRKANQSALQAARAEGFEDGKRLLSSLVEFLGYAAVLRNNPSPDDAINDANEKLLSVVYNGGEDSIQAAVSLDAGSDEHIHDTEVSFKTIHDAISKWKDNVQADFNAGSPEIRATAANAGDGSYAGSHFVSLSDIAQQPTTIGTGGISFLNESEIEGTRQPASEATNIVTEVAAPTQTLTETTPIQSTAVHVDWSTSASATNWADEDSYDTPAQSDPFALPQTNGKPTQIQEPDLQPVEDFKTIEKKSSNRDGRGRGRGSGRGRGDREGRGRGRGKSDRPRLDAN